VPSDLAGAVGRAFLGLRLQCAQCHDHPFDRFRQEDFWGVAAFFARTKRTFVEDEDDGMGVTDLRRGRLYMPAEEGEAESEEKPQVEVKPRWLGTDEVLPRAGRRELAERVVSDPLFARNLVNRVWARLFGRGIVEPLVGFGARAKPSHPELLEALAKACVESGHDLRALLRPIVLSKTYQRSCRSEGGDPALFSRAALRPLTADQIFQSLVRAAGYGTGEEDGEEKAGEEMADPDAAEEEKEEELNCADFYVPEVLGTSSRSLRRALRMFNHAEIHEMVNACAERMVEALGEPVRTDHERATVLMHTGNPPQETVVFPTVGAVASKEWRGPEDLPLFVSVGDPGQGFAPSGDPGFLGAEHAPFAVNLENPTETLALPEELRGRFAGRVKLLDEMNREFVRRSDPASAAEDEKVQKRALAMMGSRAVRAFDLSREGEGVRAAYGDSAFGRGCLLARRLVEHGVRFVEVTLDGWDTHANNFEEVPELCRPLDPAMATLVRELEDRRLLAETLVVWMGEFGRTPEINGDNGRDHHSAAFSVVLAGGGVGGGRVIGETDATGSEVKDRPVTVPDLYATILHAFGLDPAKKYMTAEGRPIRLVEKGAVVKELFS
jgi:hypothetical protein